jgi:hypothetical protein
MANGGLFFAEAAMVSEEGRLGRGAIEVGRKIWGRKIGWLWGRGRWGEDEEDEEDEEEERMRGGFD